jgi:hypothetical protein
MTLDFTLELAQGTAKGERFELLTAAGVGLPGPRNFARGGV